MRRSIGLLVTCAALLASPRVHAAFHLMKIVEVFPGAVSSPNAQFVELQMYAAGQNFVSGHSILIYNAAGTQIGSQTFAGNVANGANQARILIATAQAQAAFGVTPDLVLGTPLPLSGGKLCFDTFDCVSWGNYSGAPGDAGTPFAAATGLGLGHSMHRRLNIAGGATTLEAADDTDDTAGNFVLGPPTPTNNAGQTGSLPPGPPSAVPLPRSALWLLAGALLVLGARRRGAGFAWMG